MSSYPPSSVVRRYSAATVALHHRLKQSHQIPRFVHISRLLCAGRPHLRAAGLHLFGKMPQNGADELSTHRDVNMQLYRNSLLNPTAAFKGERRPTIANGRSVLRRCRFRRSWIKLQRLSIRNKQGPHHGYKRPMFVAHLFECERVLFGKPPVSAGIPTRRVVFGSYFSGGPGWAGGRGYFSTRSSSFAAKASKHSASIGEFVLIAVVGSSSHLHRAKFGHRFAGRTCCVGQLVQRALLVIWLAAASSAMAG